MKVLAEYKSVGADLNVMPYCSQFIPMEVICYHYKHNHNHNHHDCHHHRHKVVNAPSLKSICYHPSLLPCHRHHHHHHHQDPHIDYHLCNANHHHNQVVNAPSLKSICYHPSLLPRHRGASAISWTLIEGDTKVIMMIMMMIEMAMMMIKMIMTPNIVIIVMLINIVTRELLQEQKVSQKLSIIPKLNKI